MRIRQGHYHQELEGALGGSDGQEGLVVLQSMGSERGERC